MPTPSVMADLSTTAASNYPASTDTLATGDDVIRALSAVIRTTNAKGSDIASATTTDIGAATAEFIDVTGTTTITGLGTISSGIVRTVRFTGALTLTHNATSLILPGGANITTANGDVAVFRSLGSGNWVCVGYMTASGRPLPMTSAQLAAIISDETGSGALVFATSPTLITPTLGAATATSLTTGTITATGNTALGDAEATDTHAIKGATTILSNSASAALTVTNTGSGNSFVVEDSASPDATPFVVTATGLVGSGGAPITTVTAGSPQIQTVGVLASFGSVYSGNDASGAITTFAKDRAGAIVQSGDNIGQTRYDGWDGAAYVRAAQITAAVDGTPGTNDMPGRLSLSTTADGASSPTERLRINSNGNILAKQGAPTAETTTGTITAADIMTQIVTASGTSYTLTLDTGTNMETGTTSWPNDMAVDWYLISTASGTVTVGAAAGHTIVGTATVVTLASAHFRTRKTATNTFVTYRLS